jgi:hypothetical protein
LRSLANTKLQKEDKRSKRRYRRRRITQSSGRPEMTSSLSLKIQRKKKLG